MAVIPRLGRDHSPLGWSRIATPQRPSSADTNPEQKSLRAFPASPGPSWSRWPSSWAARRRGPPVDVGHPSSRWWPSRRRPAHRRPLVVVRSHIDSAPGGPHEAPLPGRSLLDPDRRRPRAHPGHPVPLRVPRHAAWAPTGRSPTTARSWPTSRRSTPRRRASSSRSSARRRSARTCSWPSISSEENIANKTRLQEIARKLADPRGLREAEAETLVARGQGDPARHLQHPLDRDRRHRRWRWSGRTRSRPREDAETKRRLDDVVLLLVPSLNPDGQIMETEWYRKNLGTRYEGGRMPWLYHHYAGHDNNRDWFMLTQKETQAVTRAVYHEWFPQVWLDEHQMGPTGPRIFVPPYADPVDPDVHPLVWREVNLIGAQHGAAARAAEQERRHLRLRRSTPTGRAAPRTRRGGRTSRAAHRGGLGAHRHARATSSRASSSGGGKGLVEYERADELPEPVAGRHGGGCATSWTTSGSPPTRCSRPAPSAARTSSATRSRGHGRGSRPRRATTPSGSRARQRDAAGAAQARGAAGRARRRGARGGERRRLRPARAALRPLRAGDADAAALSRGRSSSRARRSCARTTSRPGRCR